MSNNKTCYEYKNGREFVDGNADFVQDMIFLCFV